MATKLWRASDLNFFLSSVATTLNSTSSIIVMASPVSGITAPAIAMIDLEDSNHTPTPSLREYISFSTIRNTQDLFGATRGLGGSTAQAHGPGARIQAGITIDHWNDLVDFLQVEHTTDGEHVISTATINLTETPSLAVTSTASIATANFSSFDFGSGFISLVTITGSINASLASVFGFPEPEPGGLAPFMIAGQVLTGTSATPLMINEHSVTLKSVSMLVESFVSSASLIVDINKNFTSIFDAGTRPAILDGGTYVSTASIATTTLTPGNVISLDVDNGGGAELTVILET